MKAEVIVTLKRDVMDPQGTAIQQALNSLGHKSVKGVRAGRYFEVTIDAKDEADAKAQIDEMCRELLANTVIESYHFTVSR